MGMITSFAGKKKKKILPNKNLRVSYICMEDLIPFPLSYISSLWHSSPPSLLQNLPLPFPSPSDLPLLLPPLSHLSET